MAEGIMHRELSRRSWLAGSAATLAMPFVPRVARAARAQAASEADWDKLEELVKNRVFRPDDPRFTPSPDRKIYAITARTFPSIRISRSR
jgi:hypothetical protein